MKFHSPEDETTAFGVYLYPDKSKKYKGKKSVVTYVYFAPMASECGFKIGISSNPKSRLFRISWDDDVYLFDMYIPKYVQIIAFESYANAYNAEQYLHSYFGRDRHTLDKTHNRSSGKTEYFKIEIFNECINHAEKLYKKKASHLYDEVHLAELEFYEFDVNRYLREIRLFREADMSSCRGHADFLQKFIFELSSHDDLLHDDCIESLMKTWSLEDWNECTRECRKIHQNFVDSTDYLYKPYWDKAMLKAVDADAEACAAAVALAEAG